MRAKLLQGDSRQTGHSDGEWEQYRSPTPEAQLNGSPPLTEHLTFLLPHSRVGGGADRKLHADTDMG